MLVVERANPLDRHRRHGVSPRVGEPAIPPRRVATRTARCGPTARGVRAGNRSARGRDRARSTLRRGRTRTSAPGKSRSALPAAASTSRPGARRRPTHASRRVTARRRARAWPPAPGLRVFRPARSAARRSRRGTRAARSRAPSVPRADRRCRGPRRPRRDRVRSPKHPHRPASRHASYAGSHSWRTVASRSARVNDEDRPDRCRRGGRARSAARAAPRAR